MRRALRYDGGNRTAPNRFAVLPGRVLVRRRDKSLTRDARDFLFWVNTPATFCIERTIETNQTTHARVFRLGTDAPAV